MSAELIGYEWISYVDERDKRVSDWERARECQICGRKLVHVYTVRRESGAVDEVGRECAHLALGWKRPVDKFTTEKLELEFFQRVAGERAVLKEIERRAKFAVEDRRQAARDCRRRNPGLDVGPVTVLTDGARFFALPTSCLAVSADPGFPAVKWTGFEAWERAGWTPVK